MLFFFCTLVFMFIGRKIGWACSKPLYFKPIITVVIFSLFWGVATALVIHSLIVWQNPNVILRWVMGYFLGTYVAIPNYGLLTESSIPENAMSRHITLKGVPMVIYLVSIILLSLFF